MITHDLKEGFSLGTRLLVFDKLRHDPQAPHAYGAGITYDLPVGSQRPQAARPRSGARWASGADSAADPTDRPRS